MKKFIILLLLLVNFTLNGQIYTNGVFIQKGKTFEVNNKVYSITPSIVHFSNGLVAKVETNTDITINSFFQEINDINSTPHKSKFGASNLSANMMNGSVTFIYSGSDSNSSCVISTPVSDIELYKGTFYFRVTENKVIVFVLDGSLKAYGDKKKELTITSGNALVAVPNDIGILEDKISLTSQKVNQQTIDRLLKDSKDVDIVKDNVIFATIDGKIVGIEIN